VLLHGLGLAHCSDDNISFCEKVLCHGQALLAPVTVVLSQDLFASRRSSLTEPDLRGHVGGYGGSRTRFDARQKFPTDKDKFGSQVRALIFIQMVITLSVDQVML